MARRPKNDTVTKPAPAADMEKLDKPKLYTKRWFILAIFCAVRLPTCFQWIQYSVITDVIEKYYGVSKFTVVWTATIYMLTYFVWVFPATWALDRYGLRVSVILGSFLNCFGSWVKCASADPGRFWVTFLGQTIVGTSQSFTFGVATKLAAIWFGANELSTACSLGIFGGQVGVALGFLLPPVLVRYVDSSANEYNSSETLFMNNSTNVFEKNTLFYDTITHDLLVMFIGTAVFNTLVLLLVVVFFADKAKAPPSFARSMKVKQERKKKMTYVQSLKILFVNKNYILSLISFGLISGAFYSVSTSLKGVLGTYYPEEIINIGRIGLVLVLSGIAGSLLCGFCLDRTKKYRLTVLLVYSLSLVGMVLYTFLINISGITVAFVIAGFLGFFMVGYTPLGFEYAIELTYPVSEGTSSSLLAASAQLFGIVMTQIMTKILTTFSALTCNICILSCLAVGAIITIIIKGEMRRDTTERSLKALKYLGLISGAFYSVSTSLKGVLGAYYPEEIINIGHIGLVLVLSGIAGSLLCGFCLDRTKRYRLIVLLVYSLSLVGMVLYTFLINISGITVAFVIAGFLGFFMVGYTPLGFEYAIELTYPISEGTSSSLLAASAQLFGVVMTQIMTKMLTTFSALTCNICILSCLAVGAIITIIIKGEMRRDTTERSLKALINETRCLYVIGIPNAQAGPF